MMRMPGSWPSAATSCASPAVTVTKPGDLRRQLAARWLDSLHGYAIPAQQGIFDYYCVQAHFEMSMFEDFFEFRG